jgi:hypothetical protein
VNTAEMRDAIEEVYVAALGQGTRYPVDVPAGVTAQLWHLGFKPEAEGATADQFRERYAIPGGESLASIGLGLGLDTFARLEIEDRPALTTAKKNHRPRQFIVRARGWNSGGGRK